MWIRFQLTVAPAERERDVQKTGLAYPLTRVKARRFGNPAVLRGISEAGVIWTATKFWRRVRYAPVCDRHGHRFQAGFTLTELMTVVGMVGILVTLGISAASSVRTSARQITCVENLMVVGIAVNHYSEETGHRPRSFTRLLDSKAGTNLLARLICPSDPALNRSQRNQTLREMTWGNLANESQDPGVPSVVGEPESGSWQIEIKERKETIAFSYLHPLGWTRTAWDRLRAQGPPFGVAVCQLHGVRVPSGPSGPDRRNYMEYEGRFLRAQTDGAVVRRKLFREPDSPVNAVTTAAPPPLDYPWEFYTDRTVPSLK